jgi:hypothetical protein
MDALIKLGMMILTGSSMDLDLMQYTRQAYECDSFFFMHEKYRYTLQI